MPASAWHRVRVRDYPDLYTIHAIRPMTATPETDRLSLLSSARILLPGLSDNKSFRELIQDE